MAVLLTSFSCFTCKFWKKLIHCHTFVLFSWNAEKALSRCDFKKLYIFFWSDNVMSRLLYFKASLPLLTPVKSPVRAKPRAQVLASGALWYVRCWNPAAVMSCKRWSSQLAPEQSTWASRCVSPCKGHIGPSTPHADFMTYFAKVFLDKEMVDK